MKLSKFSSEDYYQYGGVEEEGTEVALITEAHRRNGKEREIAVDSNGFSIFEIDCDDHSEMYSIVGMKYGMACALVEAMTVDMLFGFELEEI